MIRLTRNQDRQQQMSLRTASFLAGFGRFCSSIGPGLANSDLKVCLYRRGHCGNLGRRRDLKQFQKDGLKGDYRFGPTVTGLIYELAASCFMNQCDWRADFAEPNIQPVQEVECLRKAFILMHALSCKVFGLVPSPGAVPRSPFRTGWIYSHTSGSRVLPAPVCIASVCTSKANVPCFRE